ncbi:MAG: hypothetical protein ACTS2F_03675 [Thainema sp.]
MRYSRPYQYEITIPIKLRIPIYIEPVVIDASHIPASNTDATKVDHAAQAYSATQTAAADFQPTASNVNVQVQSEYVEQELILTSQVQVPLLAEAVKQVTANLNLEQVLSLPPAHAPSARPRPFSLFATASMSAAMVQVLSWTFGQICPPISHDSLLRMGLKTGHPALFRSVPNDESVMEIGTVS